MNLYMQNSLELIYLSGINKVSLVKVSFWDNKYI